MDTIQTPPDVSRRTFEAGGRSFDCTMAGEGSPLLYLHGARGSCLSHAYREVATRHRLIAPELVPADWTSMQSVGDTSGQLASVMTRAGTGQWSIIGQAEGAALALRMAADQPELVKSVVLLVPTLLNDSADQASPRSARIAPVSGPDSAWIGSAPTDASGGLAERTIKEFGSVLTRVQQPVLCLFGTRDARVPTTVARRWSTGLAKGFTSMVYEAGHHLDFDRPKAVAAIVLRFLEHGESFVVNRDSGLVNP